MGYFNWTPVWLTSPDFVLPRQHADLVIIGWQDGFIYDVTDSQIVLREYPFGGFYFVVKFTDKFWRWSSSHIRLGDVFDSCYAVFPDGATVVNTGPIAIRVGVGDPYHRNGIVLDMPASDPHYYWFGLPQPDSNYWLRNDTPIPPLPFITHPT